MSVHARLGKHGRKTYYFDFVLDGQRHYATVGPSERDARNAERVERGRALEGRLADHWNIRRQRRQSPTVRAFYELTWLPAMRAAFPTSYRGGIAALKALLELCGDQRLASVTSVHIELYKRHRLETVQPNTFRTDCAWLRRFFDAAVTADHRQTNPARALALPRRIQPHYHLPTEDEAQRLISAVRSPTVRDMIRLTALLGLRRSEVTGLNCQDVNFDAGVLSVWQQKTKKTKYLPMTQPVIALLRPRVVATTPERPVFMSRPGRRFTNTGFWDHFNRARLAAGLPRGVRPHALRHALATAMLRRGEDIPTVGDILGHDPPYTSTMVYVGHTTEDRKRKALERQHEPERGDITSLAGALAEIRRLKRELAAHEKSTRRKQD